MINVEHFTFICIVWYSPPDHTIEQNIVSFNPYKSSVLFVGHRQTAQNQIRRHKTRCLIRILYVCLHNVLLKFKENL